jgi:hypothetical protein
MPARIYAKNAASIPEKPCELPFIPKICQNPIVRIEVITGTIRSEQLAIIQNLRLLFSNAKITSIAIM